jgi:predicted RNase H-like nuclease (RuvC/YqgF family)
MPVNRRRQRSVRVTVAVALLAVATVVVLGALLTGGALWLGCAAVVAWAAGVSASRIIGNELAASRREHARDRAEQAHAYSDLATQRTAEQARFSATMRQKVEDHATTISRLKANLRLAEKRAEFAEETADRNKVAVAKAHKEIASLRERIAELEAELQERRQRAGESEESIFDLEALESLGGAPTVVDLATWDGQTRSAPVDQRKQA